ncbi:MAG: transglutaminase-like domain-containing protein [Myxococcales bacterium]
MARLRRTFPVVLLGTLAQVPVVHEPIAPDAQEDIALGVVVEGGLAAAVETRSGTVRAPEPRRAISPTDPAYASDPAPPAFRPDRDTRRPDIDRYDEPFTPATAPFKRLLAYDSVSPTYELGVRDPRRRPLATRAEPSPDDDVFYADMVVSLQTGVAVRIPSVGPGARVVRARLGIGVRDVPFVLTHDGADQWFVEASETARARLVMQLAIHRGAFRADFADVTWGQLLPVPPLPERVAYAAGEVLRALGLNRQLGPQANVTRLVAHFRSFSESDEPPVGRGDIYLDLALSKKGVCRHRAFAFLVTALALGIPTRMVANEAHAWVEVHDGVMWRRIDLGGAGRLLNAPTSTVERPQHRAPPDRFTWPEGAERGQDMVAEARSRLVDGDGGPPLSSETASAADAGERSHPRDDRPESVITLSMVDTVVRRGAALGIRGQVTSDGASCPGVVVEFFVRGGDGRLVRLGAMASSEGGTLSGSLVVPGTLAVGGYEVVASTEGDSRCGPSGL